MGLNYDERLRRSLVAVVAAAEVSANERAIEIIRGSGSLEQAVALLEADMADRATWLDRQMSDVTTWLLGGSRGASN